MLNAFHSDFHGSKVLSDVWYIVKGIFTCCVLKFFKIAKGNIGINFFSHEKICAVPFSTVFPTVLPQAGPEQSQIWMDVSKGVPQKPFLILQFYLDQSCQMV